MPIFAIETATAYVGRERRSGRIYETQMLEVEGRGSDGRPSRACFIFSAAVDPARTAPVGYVTEAGDGGVRLVGWLPETEYRTYRDILAEGGALQVHFETRDRTTGYLRRLALGRDDATLVASTRGRGVRSGDQPRRRPAVAFAMPL